MISISAIVNSVKRKPPYRFTKYLTGKEPFGSSLYNEHLAKEEEDVRVCEARPRDTESLKKYCLEWAQKNFAMDFQFREHQLDYIVRLLDNILNKDIKVSALEAPTGSGKSFIAMTVAGVAWDYFRKTSYILVSDLGLMDQYINDINHFNLPFGHLRGLKNYFCEQNGQLFQNGMCKLDKMSYNQLMDQETATNKGYYCASSCPCIQDRIGAITSPVTLMTYVLYLCEINDVLPLYGPGDKGLPPFDYRDIVICDECQKLAPIVQDWCSPTFNKLEDYNYYTKLLEYMFENAILRYEDQETISADKLKDLHEKIAQAANNDECFSYYCKYEHIQKKVFDRRDELREFLNKKEHEEGLSKEERFIVHAILWLENREAHFDQFLLVIKEIGTRWLVKNVQNDWKTGMPDDREFKLNCMFEDYEVKRYFLEESKHSIMMTATLGDPEMFRHEIGIRLYPMNEQEQKFKFMRIPSTFDFSMSPIYVLPTYKLSYKEKEKNLPYVVKLVQDICNHHVGQRGIIHTGSYEFSKKLVTMMDDKNVASRLIMYNNVKEKPEALDNFEYYHDKILTGPTMIEGLNFPDDMCRFMILMKVPYASLADKLIEAKMENIKNWYSSDTMRKIIQSIGRGVRHKTDWCVTYVIDGCFCNIYYQFKDEMNPDFVKRIQFVTL